MQGPPTPPTTPGEIKHFKISCKNSTPTSPPSPPPPPPPPPSGYLQPISETAVTSSNKYFDVGDFGEEIQQGNLIDKFDGTELDQYLPEQNYPFHNNHQHW